MIVSPGPNIGIDARGLYPKPSRLQRPETTNKENIEHSECDRVTRPIEYECSEMDINRLKPQTYFYI